MKASDSEERDPLCFRTFSRKPSRRSLFTMFSFLISISRCYSNRSIFLNVFIASISDYIGNNVLPMTNSLYGYSSFLDKKHASSSLRAFFEFFNQDLYETQSLNWIYFIIEYSLFQ